jgi:hypothetical protein
MRGIELVLSGSAKVYCVHDRLKRQVNSPDDCLRIARDAGMSLFANPKFQRCACCDNVFATLDDIPQLCTRCNQSAVHALGGPLSEPIEGVVD